MCHNPHDTYDTQTITKWLESALNQLFLGAHQRNSGCRPTVDNRGGRLKCLSGPGWKRAGVYKRRFVSAVSRRQITESRRRDAVEFAAFGAQASGNRRGHRLEKDGIAVVPRRSEPTRLPAHPSIHLLLAISTGLSTLYHPTFYVYSWGEGGGGFVSFRSTFRSTRTIECNRYPGFYKSVKGVEYLFVTTNCLVKFVKFCLPVTPVTTEKFSSSFRIRRMTDGV